ncbi:MAG: very short patch repair endonuclease [Deltaproteobacteria bacterium]|nr:very short patch repair endonuclease [Deltaproteobacteria bacterium]
MVDRLTSEQRSKLMARIRGTNTKPELVVRKIVHSLGYRYRLYRSDLPGKPDLVFPKYKKIIFVHGCFWHKHSCKKVPDSEFWQNKLDANRKRDKEVENKLKRLGWDVLKIWECETKKPEKMRNKIMRYLEKPQSS